MPKFVPTEITRRAEAWKKDAAERRRISMHDPIADTLEYCAADLLATAEETEAAHQTVSTKEYALRHGVAEGTVRKWCACGRLEATLDPSGNYRIALTARVQPPRRQKRTG